MLRRGTKLLTRFAVPDQWDMIMMWAGELREGK
jgi:hypothetical protein